MTLGDDHEPAVSQADRDAIHTAVRAWASKALGSFDEDASLSKNIAWRPHLYAKAKKKTVHIMLYPGIAENVVAGLKAAKASSKRYDLVIAGPDGFLRHPAVLMTAAEVGAALVSVSDAKPKEYKNAFQFVYREGLILDADTYQALSATLAGSLANAEKGQDKGRLLETLLAFVLSQIPGFRVLSTNYNTITEEIDIVVENRRIRGIFTGYCEPILLVESKNQVAKAGKNEYVTFAKKIRNRRGACSVGLFVSVAGYTSDFRLEALRDSRDRLVVARLERADVDALKECSGEQAASIIEERIRAATLE